MSVSHEFGGRWTQEKLESLRRYLQAYMTIMSKNPRASYFETIYLDAFAGTGYRSESTTPIQSDNSLNIIQEVYTDDEVQSFQKGSASIALEIEEPFDKYVFIDAKENHVQGLEKLRDKHPQLNNRIEIHLGDANAFLQKWCIETSWRNCRAVLFLDPYGMQVQWKTLETIANTKAIDMFILFPLGQAVNRLLPRKRLPDDAYAKTLTQFFGTDKWKDAFYMQSPQGNLFSDDSSVNKIANFENIGRFFVERLGTVFEGVAPNPKPLYNSKKVPLFLLCFAAGNSKGATVAVRIAKHILDM
jgi:three-Cys-motif partner protein